MKKHLFLAAAVLAAPLLAHADLKAMDDGALSDVTGQAGISISGTFQGSVGAVTYTDTDTNGGSLRLENISLPALTIDDTKPLTIDVVTTDIGGKSTQQLCHRPAGHHRRRDRWRHQGGRHQRRQHRLADRLRAEHGRFHHQGLGSLIQEPSRDAKTSPRHRRVFLRKRYDGAMFEILLGSLIGLFGFTQTVDTKPQPQGTVNLSQPPDPQWTLPRIGATGADEPVAVPQRHPPGL